MLSLVSQDVKSLTRAPGVGKKLAERILLELQDKVKNEELSEQLQQVGAVGEQVASGTGQCGRGSVRTGGSGLQPERSGCAPWPVQPPEASVQELIKVGLKKLSGAR